MTGNRPLTTLRGSLTYIRLVIGRTGMVVAPLVLLVYVCLGVFIWHSV